MVTCQKCILPDTYPRISFDEEGVCNVCHTFDRHYRDVDYRARQRELAKIVDKAKAKKRKYDCMVPLSGGRDSSMVLYIAVKELGLRTLAYNYDNGFTSEAARNNMQSLTRSLDVDFVSYRPKVSTMMKAYRTCFLKTGDFCIACNRGVTTGIYKAAFEHDIPLILLGYCSKTDGIPREIEMFDQRLLKGVLDGEMTRHELKTFAFPQWKRLLVQRINLPDYYDWKETENFKRLAQEFSDTDYGGEVHFDCRVSKVADHMKRLKWGFGKKEMKLAVHVRDGLLTRDEALAKIESTVNGEPPEMDYWLTSLDLERSDIARAKDASYAGFKTYNPWMLKALRKYTKLVSFPLEDEL